MKNRHYSTCFMALLLVAVFAQAGPAVAAMSKSGHTDDEGMPQCDPSMGAEDGCSGGSTGGPNGNPKTCQWIPGQTGSDHLACLGEASCEAGDNGGFDVGFTIGIEDDLPTMNFSLNQGADCTPPPNPGPEDEVYSYCFREDGNQIGYTLIEVERPNLVAKIRTFIEHPTSPGTIQIGINDDLVVVDVRPAMGNVGRLNKLVCTALQAEFQADCLDDFWVVYADSQELPPTSLSLYTAVDGVNTTEVALEPIGGVLDMTACSPRVEVGGPTPLIQPR